MTQTKKGEICGKKEKGEDKKLLVISFLDVQTMGLNGLEGSYPQFRPIILSSKDSSQDMICIK